MYICLNLMCQYLNNGACMHQSLYFTSTVTVYSIMGVVNVSELQQSLLALW